MFSKKLTFLIILNVFRLNNSRFHTGFFYSFIAIADCEILWKIRINSRNSKPEHLYSKLEGLNDILKDSIPNTLNTLNKSGRDKSQGEEILTYSCRTERIPFWDILSLLFESAYNLIKISDLYGFSNKSLIEVEYFLKNLLWFSFNFGNISEYSRILHDLTLHYQKIEFLPQYPKTQTEVTTVFIIPDKNTSQASLIDNLKNVQDLKQVNTRLLKYYFPEQNTEKIKNLVSLFHQNYLVSQGWNNDITYAILSKCHSIIDTQKWNEELKVILREYGRDLPKFVFLQLFGK